MSVCKQLYTNRGLPPPALPQGRVWCTCATSVVAERETRIYGLTRRRMQWLPETDLSMEETRNLSNSLLYSPLRWNANTRENRTKGSREYAMIEVRIFETCAVQRTNIQYTVLRSHDCSNKNNSNDLIARCAPQLLQLRALWNFSFCACAVPRRCFAARFVR